ncbi:unnamed protein product [Parnassius mnemosyne]|uniref:Uncharacterized protein n=1 Tax=Parnassius mnemosyne TaxID=213953 RepID=A0AAV1KQY9_9NEOP
MSALFNCGLCCMILSSWATVQLVIMGVLLKIEALSLLGDVEAETYTDYDDFIKQTKNNYSMVAINCWIAAAIYLLMIVISYLCIIKARRNERNKARKLEDDELFCEDKSKVI